MIVLLRFLTKENLPLPAEKLLVSSIVQRVISGGTAEPEVRASWSSGPLAWCGCWRLWVVLMVGWAAEVQLGVHRRRTSSR